MQHGVILVIDIVQSTKWTLKLGDREAKKRKDAALQLAHDRLRKADPKLHRQGMAQGDAIMMVGGEDLVEIYFAADFHQAKFKRRYMNRMSVKIAIHVGEYLDDAESGDLSNSTIASNLLYRICDACPDAGVVVTTTAYTLLSEANYEKQFRKVRRRFKGIDGTTTFYVSNGGYQSETKSIFDMRITSGHVVVMVMGSLLQTAVTLTIFFVWFQ